MKSPPIANPKAANVVNLALNAATRLLSLIKPSLIDTVVVITNTLPHSGLRVDTLTALGNGLPCASLNGMICNLLTISMIYNCSASFVVKQNDHWGYSPQEKDRVGFLLSIRQK